jgi:hypothetical protein
MYFSPLDKTTIMNDKKDDFPRNVPSDEGRRNDPHIREESAQQPGVETYSSSPNDDDNQRLTRTGAVNFDEDVERHQDPNADKMFDQ